MSHVDEGALHAYLDGALDALPAAEAARIRRHLASCGECARRLEEERSLREEAAAILAGADPGAGALPPLEELRRRAAARRRTGAGSQVRQITWAASLVLAVGAGWLLRGSHDPRISQALDPLLRGTSEERAVPPVAPGEEEAPVPTAGEPPAAAAAETPPERSLSPAAAPEVVAVVEERVQAEAVAGLVAAPQAARAEVSDVVESEATRPRAVPALARSLAVTPERGGARAQGGAGLIAVPGLPVLSVETGRSDLPAGTVRVLQLLGEDTLEILHLPAGADPSSLAGPGDPRRTQVAVRWGAGWLLGRAHASVELLDSLLARLTGGG